MYSGSAQGVVERVINVRYYYYYYHYFSLTLEYDQPGPFGEREFTNGLANRSLPLKFRLHVSCLVDDDPPAKHTELL